MTTTSIIFLVIAAWIICAAINVVTIIIREGIKTGSARRAVDTDSTTSLITLSIVISPVITFIIILYAAGLLIYGMYTAFLWIVRKIYILIFATIRLIASIVDFFIRKLR